MPRLLAAIVLLTFALTGCGGGNALDDIKSGGSADSPRLTVPENLSVDKTTTRVLKAGSGAKIAEGDVITVDYLAYNGRTGAQFDSSFRTHQPFVVKMSKGKVQLPGFLPALKGQQVGSRLIAAIPPVDGFAAARPELGLEKSDTMVFEFLVRNRLTRLSASGETKKAPADVPVVVVKGGRPTGFSSTASTPETLAESSRHVLIQGSGATVKKGGVVVGHYQGNIFPAGAKFDSSWDRDIPAAFSLDGVVKCWQNLLPGVKVGSRVVLECTSADAYGDSPPPGGVIKAGDPLIFVVDVLATYTY